MKPKSGNIFVILTLLGLTNYTKLVQSIEFDRNLSGVEFYPQIKHYENKRVPPLSSYTLQNLKTMLLVISTKFSRIITTCVAAPNVPYVRNQTYYNTWNIIARTAEAAALINAERKNKSLTVIIGATLYYWDPDMQNESELQVAVEAAQISNSIYPGTVLGIQLKYDRDWSQQAANNTLSWVKRLRNMTKRLGLKNGLKIRHRGLNEIPKDDFNSFWNLINQIIFNSDFISYEYGPWNEEGEIDVDYNFSRISTNVKNFRIRFLQIKSNINFMWSTALYSTRKSFEQMKDYWDMVNKFAIEERIPVWLERAFINPMYTSMSWWKLTRNDLINNVSGYIENYSGKPVECCGNEDASWTTVPTTTSVLDGTEDSYTSFPGAPQTFSNTTAQHKLSGETSSYIENNMIATSTNSNSSENASSLETTTWSYAEISNSTDEKKADAGYTLEGNGFVAVVIAGSLVGVLVLFFLAYFSFIRCRNFSRSRILTGQEINKFKFGLSLSTNVVGTDESHEDVPALSMPYDTSLEIPKSRFNILWDERLGRGEFGLVYKAILSNREERDKDVAVKLPKQDSISTALKGILSEIKILSYLGQHPNIVSICGAYTAELDKGVVYLALELCQLGSLKAYLKKVKTGDKSSYDFSVPKPSSTKSENNFSANVLVQLIRWSNDIACGMEHLEKKNVLHADLATRNVLLTADRTAKITDFGLSRRLYEYSNYKKSSQTPLPWRWLPLESLRNHEFSVKSDVWSYGVTLWEIFSFGDLPFPERSWNNAFMKDLENGLRLDQPTNASNHIYAIMNSCWNLAADKRPNFAKLQIQTKQLLNETLAGIHELDGLVYADIL